MKHILPVLPLKRSLKLTSIILGVLCFSFGIWVVVPVQAAAGINSTINFQGKLTDQNGLNVADGTYSVVFTLYDASSNGTNLWDETQSVTTTDGHFQVALGSVDTSLASVDFNSDSLYLGIKVGTDSEMTPRIRFAAVPYAFNAKKVAGLTVTNTTGTLTIPNGKTIQFADAFTTTGGNALTLATTGTTSVTLPTTGTLLTNTATSNQTITSTQTSGTVLGLTDSTAITGATTGLAITLSGSGAFDQTGLSFNLSNASGSNLNDIVGTGNSWKVSRSGALTVSSCTGCSSGPGNDYLRLASGAFSFINDTADYLFGSNASTSAKFKLSASGTSPVASISGQTSQAALIVDNKGSGDLFTASTSGMTHFRIDNNGNTFAHSFDAFPESVTVAGTITRTTLLESSSTGNPHGTGSYTPATSFTPNSNRLLVAHVLASDNNSGNYSTNATEVTIAGGGLTWVPIVGSGTTGDDFDNGIRSFYAIVNTSPGSMQVTVDSGSLDVYKYQVIVDEYDNVDMSTPVAGAIDGRRVSNEGDTFSLTLGATPATGDVKVGVAAILEFTGGTIWDVVAGWSEIHNFGMDPDDQVISQTGSTSTSVDFDLSSSTFDYNNAPTAYTGFILKQESGSTSGASLTLGGTNAANITIGNGSSALTLANLLNCSSLATNGQGAVSCGSAGSSYLRLTNGAMSLINDTTDFLFGSNASTSAKFKLSTSGTAPVASVSARTSYASMVVDNQGVGDLFTASASGLSRFVIQNNGSVGIGTTTPTTGSLMDVAGTISTTGTNAGIKLHATDLSANYYKLYSASGELSFYGGLNVRAALTAAGNFGLGLNNTVPLATFDARSTSGTTPVASFSGATARASMIVDQSGVGDLITASKSGATKFVVTNAGNVGIGTSTPTSQLFIKQGTDALAGGLTISDTSARNISLYSSGASGAFKLETSGSSNPFNIIMNGAQALELDTSGNIAIEGSIQDLSGNTLNVNDNLSVTGSLQLSANQTIDTASGTLGIGTTNATTLTLGRSGQNIALAGYNNCGMLTTSGTTLTCSSAPAGSTNYLRLSSGAFSLVNDTADFLFGSSASTSAKFKLSASGTSPVASISGSTSRAALTVDNTGLGDLFAASKSGATKFVVNNAGNVGIGISNPTNLLHLESASNALIYARTTNSTGTAGVYYDRAGSSGYAGQYYFSGGSEQWQLGLRAGDNNFYFRQTNSVNRMVIDGNGNVGIGNDVTPLAKVDIRGTSGTTPVASVSGSTSMAALVVNNSGNGDLLTASKSGASKFTVKNNGDVQINNLNVSNCDVKSDTTGTLYCGTDSTSGTSKFLVKGTDENVPSGTTLQNDDDFTFSVGTGETWIVTYNLLVTNINSATPDWKSAILGASGWTCNYLLYGEEPANAVFPQAVGSDCDNVPTAVTNATIAADGNIPFQVVMQGRVTTTSTGSITLQWAPNTSGSLTVKAGSYMIAQRVGGSDLAEMYYTKDDSIRPGDVVSMDSSIAAGVKKSTKPYDSQVYGIVSTKPGLILGDGETNTTDIPVLVALSGRVPVKVTTENGPIKAGDLLTTSSVPGVAMKATKAGQVIGQAMTEFGGEGVGEVAAFIKTDYSNGVGIAGLVKDSEDLGIAALEYFINKKETAAQAFDASELLADRISAGLEIISPRIITDTLNVNTIKAATGKNIGMELTDDGMFVIKNASGEAVVKFDAKGNAFFSGTISAGKFVLNAVEGLAGLESDIASQSARLTSLENKIATASSNTTIVTEVATSSAAMSETIETNNLSVAGIATVSANLRVQGNGLVEGILNVVDTLTVSNLLVNKVANFFADVIFHSDIFIRGTAYFNADTAGYVTIAKGQDKADVKFSKPYKKEPVVNASVVTTKISDEAFKAYAEEGTCDKEKDKAMCEQKLTQEAIAEAMPYVIASRSNEGFTILLSQPATQDLTFSWSALAVIQAEEISLKGGDN